MPTKRDRHAAIRTLIEARAVESQEELRVLLHQRGWDVTQSTLSRDLRQMRVARIPDAAGSARYSVAGGGSGDADGRPTLEALLPQLFARIDGVGELVVLHVRIGGAQPIALALDGAGWPDVMGTIAGDDTILIICRSASARAKVVRRIRQMAE